MKLYFNICVLALMVFLGMGCESIVEIDREVTEAKITVNCIFESDSIFSVIVARSRDVIENDGKNFYYSNAEVKLFKDNDFLETLPVVTRYDTIYEWNELGESITPVEYYIYNSSTVAEIGVDYKIEVSVDDLPSVSATARIPEPVVPLESAFDSYTVEELYDQLYLKGEYSIVVQDPAGEANFYQPKLFVYFSDSIFENNYDFELDTLIWGDLLYINEGYTEVYRESETSDFDLGFESYSDVYNDNLFDGNQKTFNYNFNTQYIGGPNSFNRRLVVELTSLSEEYYNYVDSRSRQQWSEGDPFSEPVFVYNNIENGYGIFAGKSISRQEYLIEF